ncbi:DUF6233 domain-containing protein [Streptomyces sp. NPDC059037]|uniref:DUF6233 domain-containing protein n=1 Tax=Streptomyces sp. NPDC059037 TaxID=3346710 RepID=UPI003674B5FA
MNESAPLTRLDQLRFARRVVEQQATRALAEIDRWIADEERREAEQARREEARPPVPDWIVERGIGHGGPPIEVHRGDCGAAGKRRTAVNRDEARWELARGIRACIHCRPDTELGVLE